MILKEKVTVLSDNNRKNIAPDAPGAKFPLKLPSWNHSFTRIVCPWPLVMSIYHLFKKSSPILSRSLRLSKQLRLDWKICKCLSSPSSGFLNLFPVWDDGLSAAPSPALSLPPPQPKMYKKNGPFSWCFPSGVECRARSWPRREG